MTKRTPLYDLHAAAGARFVPFAGFEMPIQYTGLQAEHRTVRESVGLFDVSHMGEVRVKGPKAGAALDWLVTQKVSDIDVGQAKYGMMCNADGGVVDDVVVYRLAEDDFLICVNAANRDKDWAWLTSNNPHPAEAVMTDEGDDWVQIAVQGPRSPETLQAITEHPLADLGYYRIVPGTVAGIEDCFIARTGYTGEDGFEVFVPSAGGPAVWQALMEAGAPHGCVPVGLGARDTLRLEAKLPLYGHELTDQTTPRMARLTRFVDAKPGGFLGRDAMIARRDNDQYFLGGLVLEGKRIAREGMAVRSEDGEEVGRVTSGTKSPTLGTGIALAYLQRGLGKPGTRLIIDVRGREASAVVHKGPFYKRSR